MNPTSSGRPEPLEEILRGPRHLLHRIDPLEEQAYFLPTSRERLRGAAFIDGRTEIAEGPAVAISLADLDEAGRPDEDPARYIFHLSFCGSTLLARLLDQPGRSLTLREPNCLVDLADWNGAQLRVNSPDPRFECVVARSVQSLNRKWEPAESVTIKPSSWANPLASNIANASSPILPLFMTMPREDFLLAVLRGGRDRLAFTARLASHVAAAAPNGERLVEQAIGAGPDPVGKAVHLAALAHDLQLRLFAQVMDDHDWTDRVIRFGDLQDRPFETAQRAALLLDLDLDGDDLAAACRKWTSEHAKGAATFSADRRREEDAEVSRQHRDVIEKACRWADETLGPALSERSPRRPRQRPRSGAPLR